MIMTRKIINIDNEFNDLTEGFFDDVAINKRTANITKNQTPAMRKSVSKANSEQYANGTRKPLKNFTFKGKNHIEKSKKLMGHKGEKNGMFGVRLTGEQNHMYGKTHTDEVKKRQSIAANNRKKDQYCKHCKQYFTKQAYGRYHGDNCKEK